MTRRPLLALLLVTALAALVFTWPLAVSLNSAIPYSLYPLEGYERAPLMPGDHLQTYYWFWLLSDNLFGASPLFTNPYEFNAGAERLVSQYVNFPLSLLYVAFLPLGAAGAYNGVVIFSFLLAALGGWLLARQFHDDPWAALFAGAILAMAPARVSQIAAGQMFGLLYGLLPLFLYLVEKALASARWAWGLSAGACLLLMAAMEPHLTYFSALALGLYLPGRWLLGRDGQLTTAPGQDPPARPGLELAVVFAAGAALAVFFALRQVRQGLSGGHEDTLFIQALILWPLAALAAWLLLAALAARLTILPLAQARRRASLAFLAWLPLLLYPVQTKLDIPHLGGLLLAGCSLAFLIALLRIYLSHRRPDLGLNWKGLTAAGLGAGLGLAGAAAFLLRMRASTFLDSIAGQGRDLKEILLFSPRPDGLFLLEGGPQERFVVLGWAALALGLLALAPLLRRAGAGGGHRALLLLLAFLGAVLTLGPTRSTFPLYNLLYDHLPFFNYPRVSGRYVIIGLVFLGLLASLGLADLRAWLQKRGWAKAAALAPILALALLAWQYHTGRPMGLSTFPPDSPALKQIAAAADKGLVLELPLWPGDSHQSSRYEYDVTRTRRAMVNGYSPVVSRAYVERVFQPLYPLDLGELGAEQAQTMRRLGIGLVTFHDDSLVYPAKVSPFPPRLALQRLAASGWLEPGEQDGKLHLFRLRQEPGRQPLPPEAITSPVRAVWYAQEMGRRMGLSLAHPETGGYGLLLTEDAQGRIKSSLKPHVRGNVAAARPGIHEPGLLAVGPGRSLPPGDYLARFRLRSSAPPAQGVLGRVEIAAMGQEAPLVYRLLQATDFSHGDQWTDVALPFSINTTTRLEARVHYSGLAPMDFNLVVISFSGQEPGPGAWEAEDLLRQTGQVAADPQASGGLALLARAGEDPPIYLQHGPYVTLEPGTYRAVFHLRAGSASSGRELALVEVATDMGKRVLANKRLAVGDLAADAYAPVELEFNAPWRCEIDLRVRFLGGADLWADRVEVLAAGERR